MPCFEPPLEHEKREREFLIAALCHATKHIGPEAMESFPGLAEWKRRHDWIDKSGRLSGYDYDTRDGRSVYDGPIYMQQFIAAYPKNHG